MRFRGFDKSFWIALVLGIPCLIVLFVVSRAIAGWTQIDTVFIFLFLAGALWFVLHLVEKRLRRSAGPEEEPVFCEWDAMIDSVTFAADEELTRQSLQSYGMDLRSAVGQAFVCRTECGDDGKDYYFKGKFARTEDGAIVVQAVNPNELPGAR